MLPNGLKWLGVVGVQDLRFVAIKKEPNDSRLVGVN